jgi:subtilisin family serine protease
MPSLRNLLFTLPAVLAVPQISRIQNEHTITGKWIARIEDNELLEAVLSTVLDLAGVESKANYTVGNVKGFNFDGDDATLDILQGVGAIKSVEPDFKVYASVPLQHRQKLDNSTLVSQNKTTWGLSRVSHKKTGATNYLYDRSAGEGTYIYIIDTGINTQHSEFEGRATLGQSFIEDSEGEDDQGHGSHCAGTAAGKNYGVVSSTHPLSRLPAILNRRLSSLLASCRGICLLAIGSPIFGRGLFCLYSPGAFIARRS